jgi:hypothetical protein
MNCGRLTAVSGNPVPSTDALGSQTLWYAPYNGNTVGSASAVFTSGATDTMGLALTLGGAAVWPAGSAHDVYFYNGALCTVPWASVADAMYQGVRVNGAAMTAQTGPATQVSVPQYGGTFLGTILMDATAAGQITVHQTQGLARTTGLWNHDNRVRRVMHNAPVATQLDVIPTTEQPYGNNAGNSSITAIIGRAGEPILLSLDINRRNKHQSPGNQCGTVFRIKDQSGAQIGTYGISNYELYDAYLNASANFIFAGTTHAAGVDSTAGIRTFTAWEYALSQVAEEWSDPYDFLLAAAYHY